ncbi:MAG: glycosyltransferase [Treponema sp.]|nr:glycosyltransferase [Treponema sp.]
MMKYSVIVPFHSNLNLLTLCIDSLLKTLDSSESEIIIVDNNANGSQIDPGWELGKQCKIVTKTRNLMYPKAINLGAEYAQGEFLIFCDADICVVNQFHKALTAELAFDEIGYASAKLLDIKTGDLLEFGITSSYYNFPHPYAGRPRDFALIQKNHNPLAACAACSAIKRTLFIDIGGFDEQLVHSYSDIDLCLRLRNCQYKTVCVAEAIAYHCGASTHGSGMGASLKEDTKGVFMSKHKHIPVQIEEYIHIACDYFLSQYHLVKKDYFILDCTTIANPETYLNTAIADLDICETGRYRCPAPIRDAHEIDFLNFIPYQIRNYRISLLYFVDNFLCAKKNHLWKYCRRDFNDIVIDRQANIELLRNI